MDWKRLQSWRFTGVLILSVAAGSVIGWVAGPRTEAIKPLGDIFLNLLFCAVVPLVFFSMASAVAGSSSLRRLGRIAGWMLLIFVATGVLSSCLMIGAVKLFDPAAGLELPLVRGTMPAEVGLGQKIAQTLTVSDFGLLFGRENMLALIVFALLTGTVMSGIPGGGFIGEMLIVTLYGFGPEALPVIALLGTLVDPPATMVNASGDTVASMLVTRLLEGRNWIRGSRNQAA